MNDSEQNAVPLRSASAVPVSEAAPALRAQVVKLARADGAAKAALGFALVLIVLGLLVDSGIVAWLLAPIALAALAFAIFRAPARDTLLWLMLCGLTLESPNDRPAEGMWTSVLFPFGSLMQSHLNNTVGVGWMSFSAADVLIGLLALTVWQRRSSRNPIDSRGRVPVPQVLRKLAQISLIGTVFVTFRGAINGGNFSISLWQIEKVVYIPLMFLLFDAGFRTTQDFVAAGRVIVIAACYRSMLAMYIMWFSSVAGQPAFATSHHDSLLFATAVIIVVSVLIHRARRGMGLTALYVLPILIGGMIANNRRMVWVQIVFTMLTMLVAMPMTPVKRKAKRALLRLSPLLLVYVIAGWGTEGTGVFKPVGMIKSVTQPATDASTMTRDIENYDIVQTIRSNPIFGTGYGVGYYQIIPLPAMPHPLEPYLPHNSLLGLWFSAGVFGYTLMSLLWTTGVFFGVRAYRSATRRIDQAIALPAFGIILMYLIQCYGDIGIGSWTAVYTVAPGLAIVGKLAVATGAWPAAGSKLAPTASG